MMIQLDLFLCAFAKLRKATISWVCLSVHLFVRPSVHMEQLGFSCMSFHEIFIIFQKSVKKTQVSLKYDKNN